MRDDNIKTTPLSSTSEKQPDFVNPQEVERGPNPVIYAHLADPLTVAAKTRPADPLPTYSRYPDEPDPRVCNGFSSITLPQARREPDLTWQVFTKAAWNTTPIPLDLDVASGSASHPFDRVERHDM